MYQKLLSMLIKSATFLLLACNFCRQLAETDNTLTTQIKHNTAGFDHRPIAAIAAPRPPASWNVPTLHWESAAERESSSARPTHTLTQWQFTDLCNYVCVVPVGCVSEACGRSDSSADLPVKRSCQTHGKQADGQTTAAAVRTAAAATAAWQVVTDTMPKISSWPSIGRATLQRRLCSSGSLRDAKILLKLRSSRNKNCREKIIKPTVRNDWEEDGVDFFEYKTLFITV